MELPINQIIQGDCLEVMKKFPNESIDAIITDPPYGINYQSAHVEKSRRKPKIINDKKPFIWFLYDAFRILKDGGRILCFTRYDTENDFRWAMKLAGFSIKSQIIWDKIIHGMGDLTGDFAPQHENIIYATKGRYVFKGKRPKTVIRIPRVPPQKLLHPNEKPVNLLSTLISWITNEKEIILDPFVGSGTACVAAKQLGRKYIGIEISEDYCRIAKERLEQKVLL